ncbi:MAG: DUF3822 family protein [Chitinophagaceae bacterium]|nr:DUF3822 family protein [Chitinophagaceae bacterium]MCW5904579.1 DUF3822 family protein [Chitinophagaceae bacterium]
MVQKIIGLFGDNQLYTHFNTNSLFVEISNHHFACWVKIDNNDKVAAVELFSLEEENIDWDDTFYDLRKQSALLDKSYNKTHFFYNFNESVLIPAYKFNAGNASNYIDVIFGTNDNTVVKFDNINFYGEEMYNAYRVNAQLATIIQKTFLSVQEHHTYTGILKGIIDEQNAQGNIIFINFYQKKMIIWVVKNKKLQIIQTFQHTSNEDVLYYLLNIANTYSIAPSADPIIASGMIEEQGDLIKFLQQYFLKIYIASTNTTEVAFENNTNYPLHYFTPLFNLQV